MCYAGYMTCEVNWFIRHGSVFILSWGFLHRTDFIKSDEFVDEIIFLSMMFSFLQSIY